MPGPFALAVILTAFVLSVAILFFKPDGVGLGLHTISVTTMWYQGIWDSPMLVFAFQMMLILVLGHSLALSAPVSDAINYAAKYCNSTAKAAAIVTFVCIAAGLLNWGLGLILGAVFARKIGERSQRKGLRINYPLIGACGYTGMMVFHGGFSGSSLIKVAEPGHLDSLMSGLGTNLATLPDAIGFGDTILSSMNISVSIALLIIVPFSAYSLGKKSIPSEYVLRNSREKREENMYPQFRAERLDHKPLLALGLGIFSLFTAAAYASYMAMDGKLHYIDANFINLLLFGVGLVAHGNLHKFAGAAEEAARGASSILIQFPLYFGIMGVMKNTGMVEALAQFFIHNSGGSSHAILTFLSAALINIFIPSGGGQWMIQGPVIIESTMALNIDLGKSILAMAYGDQVTNMLQPFWALPLLAITGLRAREILPYTLFFMVVGGVIYMCALWVF